MSYLLTEIALEMLGYKFYDIDGNHGPTNFQQVSAGEESRRNEISGETLQTIIGLGPDAENVHINGSIKSVEEHANIENDKSVTGETEQKHSYSAGLKRLLDLEYKRLHNQFEHAVNDEADQLIDTSDEENSKDDILKMFLLKEKEKIEREAQTLQSFRKLVEKSTYMMNKEVFNQYKRIFGSSKKE
ncbi:unnamed protein product [Ceratitis capitata]|uniref:(Mediterranean fruit fly) hypothetical protein n=1 Tax=Ceratitis capitata TaxID=7213 RepID=A0A811UG35_CERCA|nr:unnamed protein product [Ceratitis capitata]